MLRAGGYSRVRERAYVGLGLVRWRFAEHVACGMHERNCPAMIKTTYSAWRFRYVSARGRAASRERWLLLRGWWRDAGFGSPLIANIVRRDER